MGIKKFFFIVINFQKPKKSPEHNFKNALRIKKFRKIYWLRKFWTKIFVQKKISQRLLGFFFWKKLFLPRNFPNFLYFYIYIIYHNNKKFNILIFSFYALKNGYFLYFGQASCIGYFTKNKLKILKKYHNNFYKII